MKNNEIMSSMAFQKTKKPAMFGRKSENHLIPELNLFNSTVTTEDTEDDGGIVASPPGQG